MARPRKRGLDYFPLDVNVFDDEKIFDVQNEYGPLGETVYLRLVCLVYKNGYYFKFESIEKLAAMVIRSIGTRWVESKREVVEIIEFLIDCGLFSKKFAEVNVLTSKGIQTRFKFAAERRRSGIIEYSLIDIDNESAETVHENESESGCDIPLYDDKEFSEEKNHNYPAAENDCDAQDNVTESIVDLGNEISEQENNCEEKTFAEESIFECESEILKEDNHCESERSVNVSCMDYYYNMSDFNDYFKNDTNDKITNNVSVCENGGFCSNNPTKKSKEKESKANQSKLNESKEDESIFGKDAEKCRAPSTEKVVKIFNSVCGSLPKVTKITADRIHAVTTANAQINGDFEGLFKRVEMSDFLTGRNGKWLNCSFDWIFKPSNLAKILNGNYDNRAAAPRRSGSFYFSNNYDNEEEYYESLKKLSPCY